MWSQSLENNRTSYCAQYIKKILLNRYGEKAAKNRVFVTTDSIEVVIYKPGLEEQKCEGLHVIKFFADFK